MLGLLNNIILGHLPWWAWVVAGGAAAVAADFLIPIPKLNTLVAVVAAVGLSSIGIKAEGYQEGFAFRDAQVRAEVAAEKERLAKGFQEQITAEQGRTAQADRENLALKKERDNALIGQTGGVPGPIVIPPDLAGKLYDIGRGR